LSTQTLPELENRASLDILQNVATKLTAGENSGFIATGDGGLVLHLRAKLPVDEQRLKEELPEFLARQREQRMSAAYSEWFQKMQTELKLVRPVQTPAGN
jgi:hypothetical protein